MKDIANLRQNYNKGSLDIEELNADPITQFNNWMQEAIEANILEPNAMSLATIDKTNTPQNRIVLLKGVNENGFIFYTNYKSDKAKDIAHNPSVSLNFNWLQLQRQIRITGTAKKVSTEVSKEYFQSRPKKSQLGAWASPQSQVIENRAVLEERLLKLSNQFEKDNVLPLPDNWGGYIIEPNRIEFWQGRESRLHDRLVYKKVDSVWKVERLAP